MFVGPNTGTNVLCKHLIKLKLKLATTVLANFLHSYSLHGGCIVKSFFTTVHFTCQSQNWSELLMRIFYLVMAGSNFDRLNCQLSLQLPSFVETRILLQHGLSPM